MVKNLYSAKTVAILLSFVFVIQNVGAQQMVDGQQHISALIESNSSAIAMSAADRANSRVADAYYSKQSGLMLVYLQQTYKGVDVYNSIKVLAFKNDKLVSSAGTLIPAVESRVNSVAGTPSLRPEGAVGAAAKHLNLPVVSSLKPLQFTEGSKQAEFGDLGIATDNIRVELLWMPVDNDQRLVLCWQVEIQPLKSPNHWLIRVDANNGAFVNKDNLTVSCNWHNPVHKHTAECYEVQQYKGENAAPEVTTFKDPATINSAKYGVIPFPVEAPSFPGGTPTLVTNPWLLAPVGSDATTLKWNDNGTTSFATSRGNNVYAQEDHDANDNTLGKAAKSKTALPDLDFDYNPFFDGEPQDSLNLGFALTNLFYWNNIMHDISYLYGFDEVAGNFQQNNQGRGGLANDHVIADGQDAVDIDNSNFATPPDGQNPRMQMFLFDYEQGNICLVNSPASDAGYKVALEGNVSINNSLVEKGPLTGNLVLYKDAGGTSLACDAAANAAALKGKIAVIDRGNCNFTVKIKNAQKAGAIAVIMINNEAGLVTMGGPDNTITIPAVMITLADGNTIKNLLNANTQVNVTLKAQHYLDGDLDAGVMSHEYTHGISNRLTGGPGNASCLLNAEQMGEGWSDYYALMVTTDWSKAAVTDGTKSRPLGTYVLGEQPTDPGIRKYPYSTDITVDKWTYDMLETGTHGGEVHYIGEIWCTALWEMTWAIIQQDNAINPNLYNVNKEIGNTVALKLVTEAMKLQPCSPGFIDGRDAILKADTILYNGKYSCAIWKAFAKRGMGVKASQGSSKSYIDQDADFSIPTIPLVYKHVDKDTAAQGAILSYTITNVCRCTPLNNLKIVDTLSTNVAYVSGGTYNPADRTVTFAGVNLAASQSASVSVKVKINDASYFAPFTVFSDSVKTSTLSTSPWQNQSGTGTTWKVIDTLHKSGSYSYFAYDSSKQTTESLVTRNSYLLSGVSTLSFWHFYNTEDGFDGGVVELSSDNGATWIDLGQYMSQNGYNKKISKTSVSALANRQVFSGNSGHFINTLVNLSSFAGKKVMIRFTFATDNINKSTGWFIDDISIKSEASVYNRVQLFTSTDTLENTADTITAITSASLPVTWGGFTAEKQNGLAHLTWKTLQEINTDKYIVERSADGANFFQIGFIKAAGNSSFALNYQYDDGKPLQGINYYRIKQMDKDGKFDYSAVRSLTFNSPNGDVSISPNPAKGRVGITITGNTKPLKVYLVNGIGQQLQAYDMSGQYLEVNLATVAAGVYYIKIEGEGVSSQHKLIVK